jgi:uncharacterized protein (DUF1015 family)
MAFAGLRPDTAVTGPLDDVVCPPYDIISQEQRVELLGRGPFNVVRVELPDGRYAEAAEQFAEWKRDGVLARETAPVLYGYRMTYQAAGGETRRTLGVMGALVLEPPGHGILPHEQTTPKAKGDRLELIRAVHANTSPIWCLCTEPGLADALGGPPGPGAPGAPGAHHPRAEGRLVASARDDDAVLHELWPIDDRRAQEEVAKMVGAKPLLVADGHHRYETALAYQAEQRAERLSAGQGSSGGDAGYDAVLAFVVELSEEHLQVLAIHRLIMGMPAEFDFLGQLGDSFELQRTSADGAALLAAMVDEGALGVATPGGQWLARPRSGGPDARYDLDSSRIDAALHRLPPHALVYEHDPVRALAEVRAGAANAAVLCRPATVSQIARIAEGGERMPPKTTFFWPKPRTGMVFRDFVMASGPAKTG